MAPVDGFTLTPVPGLRSPVVIMAFTGWSDTGTVTVDTGRRLVDAFAAEQFLTVDPEDYYVFTDSRPHVRIDEDGVRRIDWPKNEAYAARIPDAPNDLIIVLVSLTTSLGAGALQNAVGWQTLHALLIPWLAIAAAAILWLGSRREPALILAQP